MRSRYNNYYSCGPERWELEHNIGRNITVYNLRDVHGMGHPRMGTNELGMYRPQVNGYRGNEYNQREMPRNIRQLNQPIQKTDVAGMNQDNHPTRNYNDNRNDFRNNNHGFEDRSPAEHPVFQGDNRNNMDAPRQQRNDFGNNNNRFDNGNNRQRDFQQSMPERNADVPQNQTRNNFQPPVNSPEPSFQNNRQQMEWRRPEPQQQPQQVEQPRIQHPSFERRDMSSPQRQIQDTRQAPQQSQRSNDRDMQRDAHRR